MNIIVVPCLWQYWWSWQRKKRPFLAIASQEEKLTDWERKRLTKRRREEI